MTALDAWWLALSYPSRVAVGVVVGIVAALAVMEFVATTEGFGKEDRRR